MGDNKKKARKAFTALRGALVEILVTVVSAVIAEVIIRLILG